MAIYSLRLSSVGKTTQKAPFTAAAHLKYITRRSAVTHVMAERMPAVRRQAVAWLKLEEREDRKNARVIDKIVVALPCELPSVHRQALVRAFCEELSRGRAAWFAAFHTEGKDRDNPHCHIVLRDRDPETGRRVMFLSAGLKEASQRRAKGQSAPTTLKAMRALWERCANAALEVAGRAERIDRRTLKEQGVARRAQVHEGPNIRAMQARGVRPTSKDRVVAVRRRRAGEAATRVVRYAAIDKGVTRAEYNDALRRAAAIPAGERVVQRTGRGTDRAAPRAARPRLPVLEPAPTLGAAWRSSATVPTEMAVEAIIVPTPTLAVGQRLLPLTPGQPASGRGSPHLPRLPEPPPPDRLVLMTEPDDTAAVETARTAYHEARAALVTACEDLFAGPEQAADALLEIAEELGAAKAVERLRRDSEGVAELRPDVFEPLPGPSVDEVERAVEHVLEARDTLDLATARRESALRGVQPGRLPVVQIAGREYVIDTERAELRAADDAHERFALPAEIVAVRQGVAGGQSLAEGVARESGLAPVQPRGPGTRGRGR